jgi:hypothetical protein
MSARTPSPFCPCIALESYPTIQLCVLKHYQEQRTRMIRYLFVAKAPSVPEPLDVFYAHVLYIDLLLLGILCYQTEHSKDSLYRENQPLFTHLREHKHYPHQDTNEGLWHRRTQDDLSLPEGSSLKVIVHNIQLHHDYSMFLTWLFFNSSTLSRLTVYNGSGEVILSLPRVHLIFMRLRSIHIDDWFI